MVIAEECKTCLHNDFNVCENEKCIDYSEYIPVKPKENKMKKIEFESEEFRTILKECLVVNISEIDFKNKRDKFIKRNIIEKTIESAFKKGYIKKSELEKSEEKYNSSNIAYSDSDIETKNYVKNSCNYIDELEKENQRLKNKIEEEK